MSKEDIDKMLQSLEDGYDIIKNNFLVEQTDFLAMGDELLEENILPSVDLPLTLTDYLGYLKKEEEDE